MSVFRRWTAVALVMGTLLAGGRAGAVAPEIKDEGKFFSPETIKKANEEIRDLARKYDKDLLIETFATVPEGQAEKVKEMSRAERSKFFQKWATERADAAVVRGIYILACKTPPHLHVYIPPKEHTFFDTRFRDRLIELLVEKFQEKLYDQGLLDAIKFVRDKLAAPK